MYIVSSKSGSTSEIKAFLDYFWSRGHRKLKDRTGDHFIALTNPGTSLEKLAHERQFRRVFTADPNVGGRYSALTVFGLLPVALVGVDIRRLLVSAEVVARQCADSLPVGRNPGTVFGTVIGQAALDGRDKLTFIADREISALGAWLEQLVAESS